MKENNEHFLDSTLSEEEVEEIPGASLKVPGLGFEDHELKGPYPRKPKDPPVKY